MNMTTEDRLAITDVLFHNLVEALRGNIGMTCSRVFSGDTGDGQEPYPSIDFQVENGQIIEESVSWFQALLMVWNRKQQIQWKFTPLPGDSSDRTYCIYRLRPKDSNVTRNPERLADMREVAGQLATFFNAWKTAVTMRIGAPEDAPTT